ncbi:hypothetical protein CAPTEDRAFT_182452 [Capitella teleta]|uniref:Peptidase M24 domain-containing protein n=1 Tax=Capitella teleta TaxID=283909 RepID=R7VIR0_CAPTE|nr:hypothetical protein CAPTEDRAFT_182452 [Capitella teleta]|eukprot:ELU16161.1 hypothetical protein CAPTEDRAFT_182452 [Capitella teleta]
MAEVDPPLDAYYIPMADAHGSEYVAEADKRLRFISGFSGSAGSALVLRDGEAFIQSDGRYTLQLRAEVDCNWTLKRGLGLLNLLSAARASGFIQDGRLPVIGFDPTLISFDDWTGVGNSQTWRLVSVQENLVDAVWMEAGGRPEPPNNEIFILGMEFAGRTWQDKVKDVMKGRKKGPSNGVLVVSALDEIAGLFNLRGSDIAFNPFFFAYAILEAATESISLYLRDFEHRISSAELQRHLNTSPEGLCHSSTSGCFMNSNSRVHVDDSTNDRSTCCVKVKNYTGIWEDLRNIANENSTVVTISRMTSYAIHSQLSGLKMKLSKYTPIQLKKAIKNPTEIQGMRNSHTRDSAVLIEFLAMLEKGVSFIKAGEYWTEITAADRLEKMRRAEENNKGLSFSSISSVGSNAAIIHYFPNKNTVKQITADRIYLLDSGGQYLDGTTDVTRTMHYGSPTEKEREAYTRVLVGSIDLARAKFPLGTLGGEIAAFARRSLWSVGLSYPHGTGHGLGMYLGVHEGPTGLSMGYQRPSEPLRHGMFFSDEPGYYETDKFGVRLETIVMVTEANLTYQDYGYLEFTPFTLVPFEPNLIKYEILTANQRKWLNAYNRRCLEEVGEAILKNKRHNDEAYDWLRRRTMPIPQHPVYNGSESLTSVFLIPLAIMALCWNLYRHA